MEAILDSQADMASFLTSVRKAHCMNVLHTPPSSPESNGSPSKHTRPRLHLSKFLQRADKCALRRSRGTNGATSPGSCGNRASKSPFRAVTEMKEPFPLMLPDSPALTDESSHDDERQRLRRVSASHLDLRALARVQSPLTSNGNTPLLPSPMFKPDGDKAEAESYFAYPKSRDTPPPEIEDGDDPPYEVHRIVSGYCKRERWSLLLDGVRQSKQASQLRHASSPWTAQPKETPASSPQPVTPPSQLRKRDRTCSTESDWLASNTSHEERYRRFKQRCCGMIQHPARRNAPIRAEGEDEIMLATVLIGPGKPRLVQIQRPPSGTSRSSQSRASHADTTTEDESDSPATPLNAKKEISAFSPYDTPCQRTYGAMTPMMQIVDSSESVRKLRPAPLSITLRTTHHRIDSAIYVPEADEKQSQKHSDRTDPNVHTSTSQSPLHSPVPSTLWRTPNPTRTPTPPPHPKTNLHSRKLASALSRIAAAIEAFPSSLLHLDALLIRQLRNTRVPAHAYVVPLQQIFPAASPPLLSALAAWWCVERYLVGVLMGCGEELRDMDVDGRDKDVCKRSDESLHHIPRKARRMLGIRSVGVDMDMDVDLRVDRSGQRRALRARAEVVRASVGVVAQRLMEAVKGGWVVELWRAVGVCVCLVEEGCREEWDVEGEAHRGDGEEGEEWL